MKTVILNKIPYVHGFSKYRLYQWDHLRIFIQDLIDTKQPIYSNAEHIRAGADWLLRALRCSPDGGLSRGYYFSKGWADSHVGCAGYAAETLFNVSQFLNDPQYQTAAEDICDWIVLNQLDCGGFHKNYIYEREPRILSTAEAMFGLLRAHDVVGDVKYLDSAVKAGDWLVSVQEKDGSWRKHNYIHKSDLFTYHTKTAFGLYKLFRATDERSYLESGINNLDWALTHQLDNGFFNHASMNGDRDPQSHLIAYVLRGLAEVGIGLKNNAYLSAVEKAIQAIMASYERLGYLPATYNREWGIYNDFYRRNVTTSCLCGNAEISIILQRLYEHTHKEKYFQFSAKLNEELKSLHDLRSKHDSIRGGLKGSSRIHGIYYERFAYPNWSVKFFIDALLLEEKNKLSIATQ